MQLGSVGKIDAGVGLGAGAGPSGTEFNAAINTHLCGHETSRSNGGDGKLDQLLQELISILQPGAGAGPQQPPASGSQGRPVASHGGGNGPTNDSQGHGSVEADLSKLISLLNNALTSGNLGPQEKELAQQLLPMLEKKLVSMEGSGGKGGMAGLLQQLITALGGQGSAAGGSGSSGTDQAGAGDKEAEDYNPSAGIGADEMDAMIANANGEGPAVDFSQY